MQKYDKNPGLKFAYQKTMPYICIRKCDGAIAQLVEQRTENPCVPGSIPGGTTRKKQKDRKSRFPSEIGIFCFPKYQKWPYEVGQKVEQKSLPNKGLQNKKDCYIGS